MVGCVGLLEISINAILNGMDNPYTRLWVSIKQRSGRDGKTINQTSFAVHSSASDSHEFSFSVHIYILFHIMKRYFSAALTALLASQAHAGDDEWLSPVYKEIFQNPLPFPPDKAVS
jgi:hypothetical protein